MLLVQAISAWPHPTGSPANAMARARIMDELRSFGLEPIEQRTTGVGTRYAVAGRVTNILVRLKGTQPGGMAVLLMAHHDAVPAGPGAGDDASGWSPTRTIDDIIDDLIHAAPR